MKITTAKGTVLECEAITSIPAPPRLYLQMANMSVEEAFRLLNNGGGLPFQEFPLYTELQNVIDEGSAKVRITLKIGESNG